MIVSPDRKAQVFAEANSYKKPDIRPEQMSGAISGHSLSHTFQFVTSQSPYDLTISTKSAAKLSFQN